MIYGFERIQKKKKNFAAREKLDKDYYADSRRIIYTLNKF